MTLQIWKIEDVMNLLGYSRATVDRLVSETRAGKNDFPLPFSRKGSHLRWTATAFEEWIARRQSAQPAIHTPMPRQTKKEHRKRQEQTVAGLQRHGLGRNQNEKVEQ